MSHNFHLGIHHLLVRQDKCFTYKPPSLFFYFPACKCAFQLKVTIISINITPACIKTHVFLPGYMYIDRTFCILHTFTTISRINEHIRCNADLLTFWYLFQLTPDPHCAFRGEPDRVVRLTLQYNKSLSTLRLLH